MGTVTGLTSIASQDSLYQETGCESLLDRRKEKLNTTMSKINHNLVPEYLTKMFPSIRSLDSTYTTRQSQNYSIPKCRVNIYKSSFVPTAMDLWNGIPL